MTAKVRKRVERLYAQLVQGKPVPAWVEVAPDKYRGIFDLLQEIGIRVPHRHIKYTTRTAK